MTIDSVFPPFAQNQNAISNNRLVFSVAVSTSDCTSIFFIFAIVLQRNMQSYQMNIWFL